MKDIAIVICNFNKKEYLQECLTSLFASDFNHLSYDIIIVDNASTDGAPQMIKEQFTDKVILLENSVNTGGAGGFARGINHALQGKYRYLALLDNDIKLEKNTLNELQKYLEKNEEVGIVGSKICTMDQPDVLQELGSFIDMQEFNATTPLKGHRDSDDLPEVVECDYVPACCLLARMDVVRKIGAFDISHFIYWDDMDWCTKARETGYKVHAISSSRVFHKMGAINTTNTFSLYYFERNRILFFLKHLSKDKIVDFTNKISEELINLTFFANERSKYNSAISTLLGIDDLDRDTLGRQDSHILQKEQIDPFDFLREKKNYKVTLVSTENMQHLRRIYLAITNHFENEVVISTEKSNIEKLKKEFPNTRITDINTIQTKENELIFHAVPHIIQSNADNTLPAGSLYIDWYLNIKYASEIREFIAHFNNYKQIFLNIMKPVLHEKFMHIHTKYHGVINE